MATIGDHFLRAQLEERRNRLATAVAQSSSDVSLARLLREVDSALGRMEAGTYGICEKCHDPIEADRLLADPLVCFCLDHLTTEQQRALESDLELAAQVQRTLLPPTAVRAAGWDTHYHWQPFGLVSGDYCDLIYSNDAADEVWFLVGDVSGKGVAASMLMTHLHAIFRSLMSRGIHSSTLPEGHGPADSPRPAGAGLSLDQLMVLANRVFCESVMAGQFATMVAGRASRSGQIEIVNAGHCPVLVVRPGSVSSLPSTGLPLGMFCDGGATVQNVDLRPGECLFIYTDGLSEIVNPTGAHFGEQGLARFLAGSATLAPEALVAACLREVMDFAAGIPAADDLTLMVVQRTAA